MKNFQSDLKLTVSNVNWKLLIMKLVLKSIFLIIAILKIFCSADKGLKSTVNNWFELINFTFRWFLPTSKNVQRLESSAVLAFHTEKSAISTIDSLSRYYESCSIKFWCEQRNENCNSWLVGQSFHRFLYISRKGLSKIWKF